MPALAAAAGLIAGLAGPGAAANQFTGSIAFSADGVTTDNPVLGLATTFSLTHPFATTETGEYATLGVTDPTPVHFNGFRFNPPVGAVTPLWTFDIGTTVFSFDATSETSTWVTHGNTGEWVILGTGIASISGFDNTPGSWTLNLSDSGNMVVAFDSTAAVQKTQRTVPDGANSVTLLGGALTVGPVRPQVPLLRNPWNAPQRQGAGALPLTRAAPKHRLPQRSVPMKPKATLLAAYFLSAVLITPCLYAQSFSFSTIAGGSPGFLDGINSNAQFNNLTGVAVDGAGNVYVADQGNNAIRKITPAGTNWIVTTIAGGTQGSEDGTNTGAQFFGPAGVAVDAAGKLYVTDQYNGTIRQITPLGTNWVVSTIAGSAGLLGNQDGTNASAEFSGPAGIAVDGFGNIFVADEANNAIREIIPSGGNWIVSTMAGGSRGNRDGVNSSAQFFSPSGVAVDSSGRVFVADQFNNTIRLLNPAGSNWVVTTIAGQSIAGGSDGSGTNAQFNAPINLAMDAGNHLYVADLFNDAIRKMTLVGTEWMVTTIAGGSAGSTSGAGANAQFNLPFDVAADAFGDVFVADSQNNAVRLGAAAGSPPPTGGVEVVITPANAVSAGAGWQLDGGLVQSSGAILSGLAPGDHTISFTTMTGFTTPPVQTISVTGRQTVVATGNYSDAIADAGSLQVIISPVGAVNAGAQWRVDYGVSLWTNAAIVAGLSAGPHTISFTGLAGWTTPARQTITITNGQTTLALATYVWQSGLLQVTLSPAPAVAAGARWQVDGGTFQASGVTLSGLSPGTHAIGFNTVLGWITPSNQTVTITDGLTATAGAIYYVRMPQLAGMAVAGGGFQFVLNAQAGSNCVIEVSSDLVTWSPFSTNTVPESGSISVNDPAIATQARRFYRAVLH